MYAAEPAVYKWVCNLNWTSNTLENGLQYSSEAKRLVIYPAIKIPKNTATTKNPASIA
jgi:hypothetical protein